MSKINIPRFLMLICFTSSENILIFLIFLLLLLLVNMWFPVATPIAMNRLKWLESREAKCQENIQIKTNLISMSVLAGVSMDTPLSLVIKCILMHWVGELQMKTSHEEQWALVIIQAQSHHKTESPFENDSTIASSHCFPAIIYRLTKNLFKIKARLNKDYNRLILFAQKKEWWSDM